jgi:hypothetical protein
VGGQQRQHVTGQHLHVDNTNAKSVRTIIFSLSFSHSIPNTILPSVPYYFHCSYTDSLNISQEPNKTSYFCQDATSLLFFLVALIAMSFVLILAPRHLVWQPS